MLRRVLVALLLLVVIVGVFGCSNSTQKSSRPGVIGTDAQLMVRDVVTILGLNRNSCYNQYETPSYINGH